MIDLAEKLISVLFGAAGAWIALKTFYERKHQETLDRFADARKKEYAAQRDFEHLRRNQEQMRGAIEQLDRDFEEIRETFGEIKGMLAVILRGNNESISGVFGKRKGE